MRDLGSTVRRATFSIPVALSLVIGLAVSAGATPEQDPTSTASPTSDPAATPEPEPSETASSTTTDEPSDKPSDEPSEPTSEATGPTTEPGESSAPSATPDETSEPAAPSAVSATTDDADPLYWALPYTSYLYRVSAEGAVTRPLSLAASRAFLADHPEQVGDAFAIGAVSFVSSALELGDHYGRADWTLLGADDVTTVLLTSAQIALARERLGESYVVRNLAHIPGTRYLHYRTAPDPSEVIALLPTGTRVKMTAAQYAAAGNPAVEVSALEFYTVPWDSANVWLVNGQSGSRTRLTTARWRSDYGGPGTATARTVVAKVDWDVSRYVFVFMGDSPQWVRWLKNDAMKQAIRSADPDAWYDVRTVAHIPGSFYFRWQYAAIEKFVKTPDGDFHKLTSGEYAAAGSPRLNVRAGYVVRPAWSSSIWWFRSSTTSSGAGPISAARYQELGEPTPRVWTQLPGDSFYRWQGISTIYWRLNGHVESLSSTEYAQAGRPGLGYKRRPAGGYGGSYGENATPGTNGVVPASDLCVIPFMTTHKIRCGTLPDLLALNDAYYARFGTNLPIDTWRYSTFRSYADQVAVWNEIGPPTAARPGTSPHGYGLAIDWFERYGFSSVQNRWLAANGPTYHWVRQPWHDQGGSWGEWWHFDYIG